MLNIMGLYRVAIKTCAFLKIYYNQNIMDMGTFVGAWTVIKNNEKNKKNNPKTYPIEHSIILWLLFGGIFAYIPVIYFTFSKKHKWHL